MYLSDFHYLHIQMSLDRGSNNFPELASLKLLICFSLEKNCTHLRIFGDSMIVINWINKVQSYHNILLNAFLVEVLRHLEDFDSFSCQHVYKVHNGEVDRVSKLGLNIPHGHCKISEYNNDACFEYYHVPFIYGLIWLNMT